jgi:hypothetical protein
MALGAVGVGWRVVFLTLAAVWKKGKVMVQYGGSKVEGVWVKRRVKGDSGGLTLGVLSPGDLQELLDVGNLLGL